MGQIVKTAGGKIIEKAKQDIIYNSKGSIMNTAAQKIQQQGVENGISYGEYEDTWKQFKKYDRYTGMVGYTTFELISPNTSVKSCLTGISLFVKHEAYNPEEVAKIEKEDPYGIHKYTPYHNNLSVYNFLINRYGRIVKANVADCTYRTNKITKDMEDAYRNPSDTGIREISSLCTQTRFSENEGSILHDQIFTDKILKLQGGISLSLEKDPLFLTLGKYLEEVSRFNRTVDISYVFALKNKKDEGIEDISNYLGVSGGFPLFVNIKNKGVNRFFSFLGWVGYALGIKSAYDYVKNDLEKYDPVFLGDVVKNSWENEKQTRINEKKGKECLADDVDKIGQESPGITSYYKEKNETDVK